MRVKIIVFSLGILFVVYSAPVAFADLQTPPKPVDYTLPYPGLLPGHPFVFLKEARDIVLSFFVSQPLDKAECNLLQADKNLQASYLLSTKSSEKTPRVAATIVKAEDHFEQAIAKMNEAKSQGMDTRDFAKTLLVANLKHQEIIAQILVSARKEDKELLQKQLQRAQQFGKEIQQILPK